MLADALGTTAANEDEDEHGSDMDDEQMMALEPHLATIFRERKNKTNSKQENKEARLNIINFKTRVLDLVMLTAKTQPDHAVMLDAILPLVRLIRTTTSKPIADKAFQVLKSCFDGCSKRKVLPELDDDECYLALLERIHDEAASGGSKLHASACSKASLFVAKIVVARDQSHYGFVSEAYQKLQTTWYLDGRSKVPASMFTDWNSWSIATRKQRT